MEHVNPLPFLNNTKYDTIDVRLVAVEEMAELRFLRRHGAAVWQFFQAENSLLEPSVPLQGCIGLLGIDLSRYRLAKSRCARAVMLTRYAILGFKLVEKLSDWSCTAMCYVVEPLANTFLSIGARGNVEQTLIGFGVLHDRCSFAVNREHYRAFGLLELFHEVAGRPAKCSQRLNVTSDVQDIHPPDYWHLIRCYENTVFG